MCPEIYFKFSSWRADGLHGQDLRLHEANNILKACAQFSYKSPCSFLFSPSEGEVGMFSESISG